MTKFDQKMRLVLAAVFSLLALTSAGGAAAQSMDCTIYYWYSHAPGAPQSEWTFTGTEYECTMNGGPNQSFAFRRPEGGSPGGPRNGVRAGEVSTRVAATKKTTCDQTDRPVVIAQGTKILPELDFVSGIDTPFGIGRTYDSSNNVAGAFGARWASTIDYGLIFEHTSTQCTAALHSSTTCSTTTTGLTKVYARRPGGGRVALSLVDGVWQDGSDRYELSQQGANWLLWSQNGTVETYNAGGQPISTRDEGASGLNFVYDGAGKLTSVNHTAGRSMSFTWTNQKITNILGPDSKNYVYGYSTSGYLQSVTLPDGLGQKTYHYEVTGKPWLLTGFSIAGVRQTRVAYHPDERVQESRDEDGGHKSTFTYGTNVVNVTNGLGQTSVYQTTSEGLISQITRPATASCPGGSVVTQFDDMGRLTLEQDELGNQSKYTYTTQGRLDTRTVGETATDTSKRQITKYIWNTSQTRVDAIREYGSAVDATNFIRETLFTYYPDGDPRARLVQYVTTKDRMTTAAADRVVSYDYTFHANKQVLKRWVDGPLAGTGDRSEFEFDSLGNLIKVTRPLSLITTYSNYTSLGLPGRIVDPNGLITDFAYDGKGRLSTETVRAPGGDRITIFGYDARDNVISMTDPSGRVIESKYNNAGEVYQVTADSASPVAPMGQDFTDVRNFDYNGLGQLESQGTLQTYLKNMIVGYVGGEPVMDWVLQVRDFNYHTWTYDTGGFLSAAVGNNGQNVRHAYNSAGAESAITDSLNRVTSKTYDTHGRLKSITSPDTGSVAFEYNPLGWPTKVTDALGRVTQYAYNGHGDMIRVTSADTGITDYTYSAAGKVLTRTNADGTVVTYVRDSLGRVSQESATWAAYNGIAGTQVHSFTYDSCTMGKGRLCSFSDPSGSTAYAYLQSGEISSQTSIIGGVSFATTFTYDAYGRLSIANYPGAIALRYTYALDHRVKRIEAQIAGVWQNVISNAAYQPFGGALIGFTHGNGWNRQLDYDQDGRLTKIYGVGATHPQSLSFGYNANNLITTITNAKNVAASQTFGYDLNGAIASVSSTATGSQTWQYDLNGNRLSHVWGGGTDTYALAPGTNRMASIAGPRARSLTFDPNGNLRNETRAGVTVERRYNGFGRQVKLIRPAAQSFAQHNGTTANLVAGTWDYAFNALGQRASKAHAGISTTRFLYSPAGLLLGQTNPASSNLDTIYVWLEGKAVGMIRSGQVFGIHSDQLGRPEVVTNSAKSIVWRANNLPHERAVTVDTVGGMALGLPGQTYDEESATWHNMHRDYDASVGRYTSSDPVGLVGGPNTFAYGSNNPVSFTDPLGLMVICIDGKEVTDFSMYPDYIQVAADFIMDASSFDEASAAAHNTYSAMNANYQQHGVWSSELERYRNAEHYMFALDFSLRFPVVGHLSATFATPLYSGVKAFLSPPEFTPPSMQEVFSGLTGVNDALSVADGSLEFKDEGCMCDDEE